ncbi:snapalysin family zinc-dependent metalloprotease [Kribbella sp. NPDC023972]|uniref:snapalysin family zinc-dependent metalloprotease n=1 Tax=Kribbella sp. NPDC023972 TaxID=3154795 RepID=UPI0033FF7EE2
MRSLWAWVRWIGEGFAPDRAQNSPRSAGPDPLVWRGGPGPSCTNAYPNSAERSRVNYLWRNGKS